MSANTEPRTLIIVESPTKANTIKRYLPENCTVLASNGHIRDLPLKKTGVDFKTFRPIYEVPASKREVVNKLKAAVKEADLLILATDEDREGEAISHHLLEVLQPTIPHKRMVFHEITKSAIQKAMDETRDVDENMVEAQEARRVLDRLFGFEISPLLWNKIGVNTLSAGRVQSPGLRLIVDREIDRINFRSSKYSDIKATGSKDGVKFEAKISTLGGKKVVNSKEFFDETTGELKKGEKAILLDESAAAKLLSELKGTDLTVESVTDKVVTQPPAVPFTTSTLQQEANRKLRMSSGDTMRIAQHLYESGFITYMRTDSPTLSEEGTHAARVAAEALYGKESLSPTPRRFRSKSNLAQEAHEAIRPSGYVFRTPDELGLSGRDRALYELIWKRTLACQMADCRKRQTTVRLSAETPSGKAEFVMTGTSTLEAGFVKAYYAGSDDPEAAATGMLDVKIPELGNGENITGAEFEALDHETIPPQRFTEASLIKKLEELGIGRPSTYATIISSLQSPRKEYVVKEHNALVPTFLGYVVNQLLEKDFAKYVDYDFTKEMEGSLDKIATHSIDRYDYLNGFYNGEGGLKDTVSKMETEIKRSDAKRLDLPQISGENPIIMGKFGPYVLSASEETAFIGVPKDWLPGTVTDDMVKGLIASGGEKKDGVASTVQEIGTDPKTGLKVFYNPSGKFGAYWQLGANEGGKKPRFFGVPKRTKAEDYTFEEVLGFFDLPRTVGIASDGKPVTAQMGKYGPYVGKEGEFRSLKNAHELLTVTLEDAEALLATPKPESKSSARRSAGRGRYTRGARK